MRDPVISGLSLSSTLKGLGGIAIVAAIGTVLCAWSLRARMRSG
jgi:hypothetical protein